MFDFDGKAKEAWNKIEELNPEYKQYAWTIIMHALLEAHKVGYNAAKDFYIDKPAGWGKKSLSPCTCDTLSKFIKFEGKHIDQCPQFQKEDV